MGSVTLTQVSSPKRYSYIWIRSSGGSASGSGEALKSFLDCDACQWSYLADRMEEYSLSKCVACPPNFDWLVRLVATSGVARIEVKVKRI